MPLLHSKALLYQGLYFIRLLNLDTIEAVYGVLRYEFLYGLQVYYLDLTP